MSAIGSSSVKSDLKFSSPDPFIFGKDSLTSIEPSIASSIALNQEIRQAKVQFDSIKAKTTHEKIKQRAEQIISYLSQENPKPLPVDMLDEILLSQEEIHHLRQDFLLSFERLQEGSNKVGNFFLIGKGGHTHVYSHLHHPRLIFKAVENAEKHVAASHRGREAIAKKFHWYKIPPALFIDLLGKTNRKGSLVSLYVEALIPDLLSSDEQEELWVRLQADLLHNPQTLFARNLAQIISQGGMLAAEVGFWDVGRNFPLLGMQGLQFFCIDFDDIPTDAHSITQKGKEGLMRMVQLFPTLKKEIWNLFQIYKVRQSQEEFNRDIDLALQGLKARAEALTTYDQRIWTKIDSGLPNKDQLQKQVSLEVKLYADKILKKIDKKLTELRSLENLQKPLSSRRYFLLQAVEKFKDFDQAFFLKALDELKKLGMIVSWSDNDCYIRQRGYPQTYLFYRIYF
ncbi:MAG: hypothetical protein ACM3JI_03375 [Anaerolineae bacterium]